MILAQLGHPKLSAEIGEVFDAFITSNDSAETICKELQCTAEMCKHTENVMGKS